MSQSVGPVILDLKGLELEPEEKEILQHPLVAGIILFSRNYHNPDQLIQLCNSIRSSRKNPILITVDHEGGRVQRFKEHFTLLPAQSDLGDLYTTNSTEAIIKAETMGWLIASELTAVGIDLSFAPVLDLKKDICPAIGNRAFHKDPLVVAKLAAALVKGMNKGGMAATGKHFPGHGSVNVDSHIDIPIDRRSFDSIFNEDMQAFSHIIKTGIQAIMPGHIIFPEIDKEPVGFSQKWLKNILREQLKFEGVIISDDLNMEGAGVAGDYESRAKEALEAGCDFLLICNNRKGAIQILDRISSIFVDDNKFKLLQGKMHYSHATLRNSSLWKEQHDFILKNRITI